MRPTDRLSFRQLTACLMLATLLAALLVSPGAEARKAQKNSRSTAAAKTATKAAPLAAAALLAAPAYASPVSDGTYPSFVVGAVEPLRIDIGSRMGLLLDDKRELTFEQAMSPERKWQTINRESPNFGFTHAAHWLRFGLDNKTGAEVERIVELPIPFANELNLYHLVAGRLVQQFALGNLKPFDERALRHQNFLMPLKLAPGHNTVIIRLASNGTVEAPFRIWEPRRFAEFSHDEKIANGAIAGIMIVMILYNFFIYLTIRETSYLFYIGFVASYLLFAFSLNGYAYEYLWPKAVWWNSIVIATFISCSSLFINLFAISFLKLRQHSRPAWMISVAVAVVSGISTLSTLVLPYQVTVRFGTALATLSAVFALSIGYWLWWQGKGFARYFCLAWTAFLCGTMVLLASKYGMLPQNFWTDNASQMGILLLVVLLSVTLADQINLDRKLRMDAQAKALESEFKARQVQQELLESKEQANRMLEQRVQERTRDLNGTLEQLRSANEQLQQLSITDGLTQVSNRAFFDKALVTEYRRAHRTQSLLSIIIFDIDHFKRINDTYCNVSAKTNEGLDNLLDMIILVTELEELVANPDAPASGSVIESKLDPGRGPVVSVLVNRGTLRVGDSVVAGAVWGKVRAMHDYLGAKVDEATPGMPVEVLGFDGVCEAGEFVQVVENDRRARQMAQERLNRLKAETIARRSARKVTLEEIFARAQTGDLKELNIVLKSDVAGSLEALQDEIAKVPQEQVAINIIRAQTGGITESDVMLASASNAVIIGFNVRPLADARRAAQAEGVDIRTYSVIYKITEDLRAAMEGMLDTVEVEDSIGEAEVREVFKASKVGRIAGCVVTEGRVQRDASVRLVREGTVIWTGQLDSLRRFKDAVQTVEEGQDCGIVLDGYADVKVGDVLEFFSTRQVEQTLS